MITVTFVEPDGTRHAVRANPGDDLMHAALSHDIDGIIGECGGAAACATCHMYLDPAILAQLPAPDENELDMLDFAAAPRTGASRLGCQVKVSEAMEGMVITLPAEQV